MQYDLDASIRPNSRAADRSLCRHGRGSAGSCRIYLPRYSEDRAVRSQLEGCRYQGIEWLFYEGLRRATTSRVCHPSSARLRA
jgi:hypothetical protein